MKHPPANSDIPPEPRTNLAQLYGGLLEQRRIFEILQRQKEQLAQIQIAKKVIQGQNETRSDVGALLELSDADNEPDLGAMLHAVPA